MSISYSVEGLQAPNKTNGLSADEVGTLLLQALSQIGWTADPDNLGARTMAEATRTGEATLTAIGLQGACLITVRTETSYEVQGAGVR